MKKILFTPKDIQNIKLLYDSGIGSTTIATQYKVSWPTINRLVVEQEWIRLRDRNYEGQVFHKLTILKQYKDDSWARTRVDCSCACGGKTSTSLSKVTLGHTKSCKKCCQIGKINLHSRKSDSAFNRVLDSYRSNARRKNLLFSLSVAMVKKLFGGVCFYCGDIPSRIQETVGQHLVYNGIDRLDNSQGYTETNSVSCCTKCNYIKNKMSLPELLEWVRKVAAYTQDLK